MGKGGEEESEERIIGSSAALPHRSSPFHPGCKPVHSFPASIVLSSPVRQLIGARYLVQNSSRKTMLIAARIPTRETRVFFQIHLCFFLLASTFRFSFRKKKKTERFSLRSLAKKERKGKNDRARETRVTTVPTPVFLQAKLHSPHVDSLRGRQAAKFSSRFSILHSRRVNDRTRFVFRYQEETDRDSKLHRGKKQTFLLIPQYLIPLYVYVYIYIYRSIAFRALPKAGRKKECIYRSTVKNCITE